MNRITLTQASYDAQPQIVKVIKNGKTYLRNELGQLVGVVIPEPLTSTQKALLIEKGATHTTTAEFITCQSCKDILKYHNA